MPRGEHPNSKRALAKNRKPFDSETALKAKKKSDEAKALLKSFRELDEEVTTNEERIDMLNNLKKRAKYNNKAFEIYRDTVGLKPDDRLEIERQKLELLKTKMEGGGSETVDDWIAAVIDGGEAEAGKADEKETGRSE